MQNSDEMLLARDNQSRTIIIPQRQNRDISAIETTKTIKSNMKRKTVLNLLSFITCWALIYLVSGCSSVGDMRGGTTGTDVQLSQRNYKMIRAGAVGHSYGFDLLGILPFDSPTAADAKADLYKSVGQDLTGRAVALANQTEDRSSLYLILFSIPRITYTADVIEFVDQPTTSLVPEAAKTQ